MSLAPPPPEPPACLEEVKIDAAPATPATPAMTAPDHGRNASWNGPNHNPATKQSTTYVAVREWAHRDMRMVDEVHRYTFQWFYPMVLVAILLIAIAVGLVLAHTQLQGETFLPWISASATCAVTWTVSLVYVRMYMSGTSRIIRDYTVISLELLKSDGKDVSRSTSRSISRAS